MSFVALKRGKKSLEELSDYHRLIKDFDPYSCVYQLIIECVCYVCPGVDVRIILRRIFKKWDVGVWTGSSWLGIGTGDR